jgi:hypothetical protein
MTFMKPDSKEEARGLVEQQCWACGLEGIGTQVLGGDWLFPTHPEKKVGAVRRIK